MTTKYVTDWFFANEDTVRRWMAQHAGEYYDCGVVKTTKLAEDAALQFDLYEGEGSDYTIPECVFELALEVAEWYELDEEIGDDE
jgi:hypothetical protein